MKNSLLVGFVVGAVLLGALAFVFLGTDFTPTTHTGTRALAPAASTSAPAPPHNWLNYKGSPARTMDWTDERVKPPFQLKWVFWGEDSGTKVGILAVDGVILFPNVGRFGGGNLFGIDAETGKELWRQKIQGHYLVMMDAGAGLVFFPETPMRRGRGEEPTPTRGLVAFDVRTGERVWNRSDLAGDPNPLAMGSRVYSTANAKRDVLFCVDAKTGETVWERNVGLGQLANASSDGEVIVVTGTNGTGAVEADTGEVLWRSPAKAALHGLYPTMIGNGMVYVPRFGALNLADGKTVWTSKEKFRCLGGDKIFGNTFALNALTGELLWRVSRRDIGMAGDICGAPFYNAGAIYFGTGFPADLPWVETFFALDAKDGEVLWRWKSGSVVCTSPITYDGRLYFGSADRGLYCFEPAPPGTPANAGSAAKEDRR